MAVSFGEQRVEAALCQFYIDAFERETHSDIYALSPAVRRYLLDPARCSLKNSGRLMP